MKNLLIGADVSMLDELVKHGAVFYEDGKAVPDLYRYFCDIFPCARLRLFVNPTGKGAMATDLAYVKSMADKYHAAGGTVLLDFHYSDSWADPGKQTIPAAWQNFTFDQLCEAVYDHTLEAVKLIKPEMVQIGNEITPGMLWEHGRVVPPFDTGAGNIALSEDPAAWGRFARLLQSGIAAAKAADPAVTVMIHVDQGGRNDICQWFYRNLQKFGVEFDVIGLSYYPFWHGSLAQLEDNMLALHRQFGKFSMVVETAHPYRGNHHFYQEREEKEAAWNTLRQLYPVSPEGQRDFSRRIIRLCEDSPVCSGLFYWAPEWFPKVEHPDADSAPARATFDTKGNALPAVAVWREANFKK